MSGHPHADLMAKAAEIAKTDQYWQRHFEEKFHSTDKWNPMSDVFFQTHREYRLKPTTITINNFEVPTPLLVAPNINEKVWMISFSHAALVRQISWSGESWQLRQLFHGFIHSNEVGCLMHAEALISPTKLPF
ncbi:hypothetical protein ACMFGU_12795 [Morganella morganii]|uniref:hypothetical protein n=1 Tax=Morganella morganii TaxID=582 RepID=UPI003CF8D41E